MSIFKPVYYERVRTRDRLLCSDYYQELLCPGTSIIIPYQPCDWCDHGGNNGNFSYGDIIFEPDFASFPETGSMRKLYFDLTEKILYYYNEQQNTYTPINTLLIEHTILNGGEA